MIRIDQLDRRLQLEREKKALQAEIRRLKNENDRLKVALGQQELMAQTIADTITAAEPFPRVPYKVPSRAGSPVSAVFCYSDWHIGARVSAGQVEGVNAYSYAIAKRRINYISDKQISWIATQRNGYRIDEAWVLVLEDMISGGIHEELRVTNEWPEPVQAVNAGLLLGEMILKLSAHFACIHVVPVGVDNHSRISPKYQFGDAHLNTWCFIVHEVARLYCSRDKRVDYQRAEGIKKLVTISRHNFLLEHGHLIRGWAGFPYYGIGRVKGKEALRRMRWSLAEWRKEKDLAKRQYGFDYYCFGHFHVPCWLESDVFINGSLQGTTEFDHAQGRFSRPSQISFLVHPRWGVFNYIPFTVHAQK